MERGREGTPQGLDDTPIFQILENTLHPATVHGVAESLLSGISPFFGIYGIDDLESRSEVIQGHQFGYQSKVRVRVPISGQ